MDFFFHFFLLRWITWFIPSFLCVSCWFYAICNCHHRRLCAVDHQQATCLLDWLLFSLAADVACASFDRHRCLFNLWAVPFLKIENTQSLVFINVVIDIVAKLEQYLGPNVHIKTVETLRGNCDIFKWNLPLSWEASLLKWLQNQPPSHYHGQCNFFFGLSTKKDKHSWAWNTHLAFILGCEKFGQTIT